MSQFDKPTFKQEKVIAIIQCNLGVYFHGKTTLEAQQFISKYMEASKKAAARGKTNIPLFVSELLPAKPDTDTLILQELQHIKDSFPSNPQNTELHFTSHKDAFGSYSMDRNGDVMEDEDYDDGAYADTMFASM